MIYILSAVAGFILFIVIINYLRKLHWDVIHNNLLDLVDDIGGKVIRQGMLGRPIYHGKYEKLDITINFSTEKGDKGRKNLIDISIGIPLKQSFTISAYDWLKEREESAIEEFADIDLGGSKEYGMRNTSGKDIVKKNMQKKFHDILKQLDPFLFLFVGLNGVIYEKEGENLAVSTKHPALKSNIMSISTLIGVLN